MKETIQIRERNHNSVLVRVSGRREEPSRVLSSSSIGEVKYLASLSRMVVGKRVCGQRAVRKSSKIHSSWGGEVLITIFFLAAFLEIVMTAGGGKNH